jgi:small-conductance mechanosensitive channel
MTAQVRPVLAVTLSTVLFLYRNIINATRNAVALLAVVLVPAGGAPATAEGWAMAEDAPAFPAETLNAGLEPVPDDASLATPQATLEFFFRAARRDAFAEAAHALNLRTVPPERQPERGAALARQLNFLLVRHDVVDWAGVPDRPDARVTPTGPQEQAVFARRTVNLGSLALNGHRIPVNLQRFARPDGTAVWLVSPFTVEHVPALYDAGGPSRLERQVLDRLGVDTLAGRTPWALAAIGVLLALALLLTALLYGLFVLVLRHLPGRRVGYVVRRTALPMSLFLGAVAFRTTGGLVLPLHEAVSDWVVSLSGLVMLVLGTWAGLRLVSSVLQDVSAALVSPLGADTRRERQVKTQVSVARRIVLVCAAVAGTGLILARLEVFETVSLSLLASAGAFTVLLAIAAQPVLGNLIAGLQIALTGPVRIGDVVEYEGHWARVEDITFTYVLLRTWMEKRLVVPHLYLLGRPLLNWSRRDEAITRVVELVVDYRADVAAIRAAYEDILKTDGRWTGRDLRLDVVEMRDDGVVLWAWVAGADSATSWDLHNDVRERLLAFLQQHAEGRFLPRRRHIVGGLGHGMEPVDPVQAGNGADAADRRPAD